MTRTTVDIGIDLGTTNSAIAMVRDGGVEVFKNGTSEVTPSVVNINKKGTIGVGERAANAIGRTGDRDTKSEFKRLMGQDIQLEFAQAGVTKSPEELSAEVLKELRRVAEERGEEVRHAVITIPAMFELAQNGATERAAQLAGFEYTKLLQEPIAAAIGYGFNKDVEDGFWLVYDLGGGTFDTSVLSIREGDLTVVDHSGDNFLGGKDFDWLIVERLMIPRLQREYDLESLSRGNDAEWCTTALAKLKRLAEEAKISLSRVPSFSIERFDDLFEDESGESVDLELEITQSDYNGLIAERIDHTLKICRDLLSTNSLSESDVARMILVGGPTNTPYLREKLGELGIQIEVGVDPMTVVARGAAIYASTQRIPADLAQVDRETGCFYVELEYRAITQDLQPLVGGKIVREGGGDLPDGLQVEIRRGESWKSGDIPIDATGMFMSDVVVGPNRSNEFQITVQDGTGSRVEVSPSSFTITHGGVTPPDSVPLSMSVRLAKADGTTEVLIEKGTPYPCRSKPARVQTVRELRPGTDDSLRIPLVQGEYDKPERNLWGGRLVIPAGDFPRVLPAGSEVEVEISVNDNGAVSEMSAFVVPFDQSFDQFEPPVTDMEPAEVMRGRIAAERDRLTRLSKLVDELGDPNLKQRVDDLAEQKTLSDLEDLVAAQEGGDPDASGRARALYVGWAKQVDEIEDQIEWPRLKDRLERVQKWARGLVQKYGDEGDQHRLDILEREAAQAVKSNDKSELENRIEALSGLGWSLLVQQPGFWIYELERLSEPENLKKSRATSERLDTLFSEGRQAIAREDWGSLESTVRNLHQFLPDGEVLGGDGIDITDVV